jgi:hypothetical protein
LYSLGTWFVSGIYICIYTLHEEDSIFTCNNNNNNNKLNERLDNFIPQVKVKFNKTLNGDSDAHGTDTNFSAATLNFLSLF